MMRGTPTKTMAMGRQTTQKRNIRIGARAGAGANCKSQGAVKKNKRLHGSKSRPMAARRDARGAVTTKALPEAGVAVASAAAVEVAQLAVYENEIWQTAGIVFGCVLLVRSIRYRARSLACPVLTVRLLRAWCVCEHRDKETCVSDEGHS